MDPILLGVGAGVVLPEDLLQGYVLRCRVHDVVASIDQDLIHFDLIVLFDFCFDYFLFYSKIFSQIKFYNL